MFTKPEVKEMGKGFHESRTHKLGNRQTRRGNFKGLHNVRKAPILKVMGTMKFLCFVQKIVCANGRVKYVEHSIAK